MEDDNKEELHFKSLSADLKDLPPFERLNAKKGNKRRCAKVSNGKQQPSCFPKNRTSQPTPANFFPIWRTN